MGEFDGTDSYVQSKLSIAVKLSWSPDVRNVDVDMDVTNASAW